LIILFFVGLLPVLDMLGLMVSYGFGWYLNFVQGREAALTMVVRNGELTSASSQDTDDALNELKESWLNSGFGNYTKATDVTQVALLEPLEGANSEVQPGTAQQAKVATTITMEPFLRIPFVIDVPGLNAPVTFSYLTTRMVEDSF